jgi:serine/threonine protein kinase
MSDWGHEQFKSFENEKRAYFELRSSNIVACFGCMRKKVTDKKYNMFLLLQWCERGSLLDLISQAESYRKISFRRRMGIVKTLVSGLRLIHAKGFVHKDIKPDNILLDRYLEVKIGDLGIAVEYVENKEMYSLAHQEYAAPELKTGDKSKYDNKVDIYSLGLVINLIFTEKKHTFRKEKGKLLVDFPEKSEFFMDIIEQCVEWSPALRPTSARIELFFEEFDDFFWKSVR